MLSNQGNINANDQSGYSVNPGRAVAQKLFDAQQNFGQEENGYEMFNRNFDQSELQVDKKIGDNRKLSLESGLNIETGFSNR